MIERLQLAQWRAFEGIDLHLGPGTTFVVAPNGVGKTSLLLGIVWALFGEDAPIDARECIRAGATRSRASVDLVLPNGRNLTIRREVATRGRSTSDHQLDGESLSDDELKVVLHDAYGAQPRVAAQLSFMVGGGHVASEKALDLKDHLYDVFGITGLRAAATAAASMARVAVKERESIRTTARKDVADRGSAEERLAQLHRLADDAQRAREPLERALADVNAMRDAQSEWIRFEAELARREAVLTDVLATARSLDLPGDEDQLDGAIEEALARHRAQLRDATERITDARARQRSAAHALSLLDADEPSCPTCLRPFHGAELQHALSAHRAEADAATADEAAWRDTASTIEDAVARLDKLRQSLAHVPSAPQEPLRARPERNPDEAFRDALAALQAHDAAAGEMNHERTALQTLLGEADEGLRLEEAQRTAYRREAISRAAAAALAEAAEQLTALYIEPLSQQIRWRWKTLFGEEGLQLKPDGTIVRVVGDRELSWNSLSGGERIWARLVTHLIVLGASTRLPFAWFDEPLEHLDPRARRAVASALATATRSGGPTQLIVTTYEHAIARQLAADVPEASVRYIRHSAS